MYRASLPAVLLVALLAVMTCNGERMRRHKSRTAQLVNAALQEYMANARSKAGAIRSQVLAEFYYVVSHNTTTPDGKKNGGGTVHGLLETFKGNIMRIAHKELHFDAEEILGKLVLPFNAREKRRTKSKSKGRKGSDSGSNSDGQAATTPQRDLQVCSVYTSERATVTPPSQIIVCASLLHASYILMLADAGLHDLQSCG